MKKGGECGFREAANSEFNIQNSKLTAGGRCSRAAACGGRASGPADASAGLRGAKLRPTAPSGRKFRIQYSKFKINCRGPMFAGCSLRRSCERTCGRERGPSRGEAAARCALRAQIQNSIFKIQNYKSGSSLRRTQRRKGVAGLRRAEAAARTVFARPISTRARSRAERPARADLRDAKMQPSARGRLRAADRCATDVASED